MIEEEINVYDEPLEDNVPVEEENVIINQSVKELFFVYLNDTLTQADKTSTEIYQALQDGLYPVGIHYYNGEYYATPFIDVTENQAICQVMLETNINNIGIDTQGNVTRLIIQIATSSDIPDVSNFITRSVNDLVNYYTKNETYTQTEVNNLIGSITTISIQVVEEKPVNPQTNIIYFIPKNPAEEDNIYNEWIYVNNDWELIGTTEIDLSNYYTKSETDTLLSAKQNTIDSSHKLDADLVDDTNTTNKFVSNTDITNWNSKLDPSALNNYYTKPINNSFGGIMMPDTTNMTPIKTIEYDIQSNSWLKVFSIANTQSTLDNLRGDTTFRITITGENIATNVVECVFSLRQVIDVPFFVVRNFPGEGRNTASKTGLRYLRTLYPKALNNGYNWELEMSAANTTSRHIKIEVFSETSNITWYSTPTNTTYNSSNQTATSTTLYTSDVIAGQGNYDMTVANATKALYLTSYLSKTLGGTLPSMGQASLANQFIFLGTDNKLYPFSNTTTPIETSFGFQLNTSATALNSTPDYTAIKQKYNCSNLSNIPHATLTTGIPCYLRCTMDANGNIYSDNYIATSRTAGYTWYLVGFASSSSAISVDTTQSTFYTLDANGKLTHIDGLEIA